MRSFKNTSHVYDMMTRFLKAIVTDTAGQVIRGENGLILAQLIDADGILFYFIRFLLIILIQ